MVYKIHQARKSNLFMMKIVMMLISADVMATSGILNPAMGELTRAFPSSGPGLISLIATIISISMIPSTLLAGKLAEFINKKKIAYVGSALVVIGGVCPVFLTDIYYIIALRGLLGIGVGLLNPLSVSMIRDVFDGEQRAAIIGYAQAGGALAVVLLQLLAGFLATYSYRLAFLAYGPMVVVPILAYFYLPSEPFEPTVKDPPLTPSSNQSSHGKIPPIVFGLTIVAMISGMALKFFFIKFAIYLMEENIGTSETAGALFALQIFGMLISSFFFGKIFMHLKHFTPIVCWTGLVVAVSLLYYFPNFLSCVVSQILFGLAFANIQPYFYMIISILSPKRKTTLSLAVFQAGLQFAAFLSTFITSAFLLINPGASTRDQLIAPLTLFILLAIGALVFMWTFRPRLEVEIQVAR